MSIRTHVRSRRAAVDLRLRLRGQRDRHLIYYIPIKSIALRVAWVICLNHLHTKVLIQQECTGEFGE
jgi:hypothetical protein